MENINHSNERKLNKQGALYSSILDHYNKNMVGQDHVKQIMAKVLSDIHQDLNSPKGKPLNILFFKGPTGVGKTELAKQTASLLFWDKNGYTRIDCEQLRMEHEGSATLFGSPAGYVWFEKKPLLHPENVYSAWHTAHKLESLHKIANSKYQMSIILFDEIEKMHPKTIQSLLSMIDEGIVTLKSGQKVDFKNTIIIFTSNIGETDASTSAHSIGFWNNQKKDEDKKQKIKDTLFEQTFSPEFRGRLDHVVEFEPLEANFIDELLEKYKHDLINDVLYLTEWRIALQYDDEVNNYIKEQVDTSKWYRNVDKVRDNQIRNSVGTVIKVNELTKSSNHHILQLFVEDGSIEFQLQEQPNKNYNIVPQDYYQLPNPLNNQKDIAAYGGFKLAEAISEEQKQALAFLFTTLYTIKKPKT